MYRISAVKMNCVNQYFFGIKLIYVEKGLQEFL